MILNARKNGMNFRFVLCITCDAAAWMRNPEILPGGWVDQGRDTHSCPNCSQVSYKVAVEHDAKTRAQKLIKGWVGQGLTEQGADKDDLETMRQDLVAAFIDAEKSCRR